MTRRDKCHEMGISAARLTSQQAAAAWYHLSGAMEDLGAYDIPKFEDLLKAIARASSWASRQSTSVKSVSSVVKPSNP